MNNQHKGAQMQLLGQFESTYRTQPGAAGALKLPFISWGLGRDPQRTEDPSVSASPLAAKMGCGDAIVAPGSIQTILDLRSAGFWLKALLGAATVGKAVTSQPVNVTGVTIHYANGSCPTGNGTLTFTAVGTTLTWAPQGGSAGAAVNVSAGGRFTLQGGAANQEIVIDVEQSALPVANQNDATIAVSGTMKTHVFPLNLNDPPSFLAEIGHLDSGNNKFYRYLGAIVSQIGWPIVGGDQNLDITAFAGVELSADTTPAVTTVWDGAPTQYDPIRACGHGGSVSSGAAGALGVITAGNININNNAAGESIADGLEGYGHVDAGEKVLSGELTAIFSSANLWTLARAQTSTRVRLRSGAVSGGQTFQLVVDCPSVEFMERPITKSGKSGLKVTVGWRAHRNIAGTVPLIMLTNDVTSY